MTMNIEYIREYCLSKPGVTEGFPFDDTTLVFKVMGKIFCIADLEGEAGIALKNTPEKVIDMRESHACISPASHLSKIHWNRIQADYTVSPGQLKLWIDESYEIVIAGLTRKLREELKKMSSGEFQYILEQEYIELISLLKYLRLSETGGHAKMMVDAGLVTRNGETEYRRRAKIRAGEILEVEGHTIRIIPGRPRQERTV